MRNRSEFVQLIDRYRLGQAQRLSVGLTFSPEYRSVHSSLVLAEGRGKFLRPRWIENRKAPVPESISQACQQLQASPDPSFREFAMLKADLTRVLARATDELATFSGVHSKMLLAACVDEPGIWISDYDGKPSWQPFCEPEQHAELTGLTTIDALPGRDLAAGGRGWPLNVLSFWLMFADRNATIAERPRLLIHLAEYLDLVWLPESDGLDDELPALRFNRLLGAGFERRLLMACGKGNSETDRWKKSERDDAQGRGKVSTELAGLWNQFSNNADLSRCVPKTHTIESLVSKSIELVQREQLSADDVLATLASYWTVAIKRFIGKHRTSANIDMVLAGNVRRHGLLRNEINQMIGKPWLDTASMNYDPEFLTANAAAITGLMHLDQMPTTVPWISGCQTPRVLGRLTPGSPGNWRRVIMEMGDCRPPVMKLKEAI